MRRAALSIVAAVGFLTGACGGPDGSPSPIGEPQVACVAVPQGPCEEAAGSVERSDAAPIVQITVTCTIVACTPTEGEVRIDMLLADGRRDSSGYGYASAGAAPAPGGPAPVAPPLLTVVPICLGLPLATCEEMAESAIQGQDGAVPDERPKVARITVRCTRVCTPASGEGETRIDYVDGTNVVSSWSYMNSDG